MKKDNTDLKKVRFSKNNEIKSFNTAKEAFTPNLDDDVSYRDPLERGKVVAPPGSLHKLNYEDNLRRVAVVIHQHIRKGEALLKQYNQNKSNNKESSLFNIEKMKLFSEENFILPQYAYHFVRAPITRLGFLYGVVPIKHSSAFPTVPNVLDFLLTIFVKANLTAECSIVCLIYTERLIEEGNVPLVSTTWRPCLLCALLLASKVWQDYGTWNVEFAEAYPQFTVKAINELELLFCEQIKFKLYVSSSLYAQYYFALRSLAEKNDFRRKYNATFLKESPDVTVIEENSKALFSNKSTSRTAGIYSSSLV